MSIITNIKNLTFVFVRTLKFHSKIFLGNYLGEITKEKYRGEMQECPVFYKTEHIIINNEVLG